MKKTISILGATGSIGLQTLDVVRNHSDKFTVAAITANSSIDSLAEIAREFHPKFVGCVNADYKTLKEKLPDGTHVEVGSDALINAAIYPDADIVVVAVVGMCGLKSVMAALNANKQVALANKESLVSGGELVISAANKIRKPILPIDSEHSAIWQALNGGSKNVKRLILTASGGAYYFADPKTLDSITPEKAVKHPNWSMGKKISVDSATMMNKALEIIEATFLFQTKAVDYVIHPQSIVHSMIEYIDGSIIAQASYPDMRLPIMYALSYPDRLERTYTPITLPLNLSFFPPNEDVFNAPMLARRALEIGGNAPAILNAANEAAVQLFLSHKITFTQITNLVALSLEKSNIIKKPTIEDIYNTHEETMRFTLELGS